METSVFEKIIARELPAEIVYEDEDVIAILDIAPHSPGHTLVVPKKRCTNIFDAPAESWAKVLSVTHQLAPHIRDAVDAGGINIVISNGEVAGQEVPHLHVHIIPRHNSDGFILWKSTPYTGGEREKTGEAIRQKINASST
jgi:histidine triad (HIT) family protein